MDRMAFQTMTLPKYSWARLLSLVTSLTIRSSNPKSVVMAKMLAKARAKEKMPKSLEPRCLPERIIRTKSNRPADVVIAE